MTVPVTKPVSDYYNLGPGNRLLLKHQPDFEVTLDEALGERMVRLRPAEAQKYHAQGKLAVKVDETTDPPSHHLVALIQL